MVTKVRGSRTAGRLEESSQAAPSAPPAPRTGGCRARTYLVDFLVLVGLCLLFFWRDLTPSAADHRRFANGDFANQFYAFAAYEAARLHAGQLPLWNPYTFAGHPFLADIQSAIFYPLSLVTMLLTAGSGFTYQALQLEAVLHFPLAGIFTYLLARRLTGSRPGALVAAATFTFSGYLTSYPPLQLAVLEVQAWLPLILLLLDVSAGRAGQSEWSSAGRWAMGAGLVLGISFLAGHPQSSLLVLYAALAFGLYRTWPGVDLRRASDGKIEINWRQWARPLGLLVIFAITGCGLAAVQLAPSWQFIALSTRAGIGFEEAGQGFTTYDLLQVVLPAVGVPFPALYVGILPLGLAALALSKSTWARLWPTAAAPLEPRPATSSGRSPIPFLGWGALLALLLSFGKITPIYAVFYLLAPGWRLFRGQERTIAWAVLAVALLAGFGVAWLASHWADEGSRPPGVGERGLVRGYGLAALVALAAALACFVGYQAGSQALWGFTAAFLFLALLAALAALALSSRRPVLLLALVVFYLFTQVNGSHAGRVGVGDPFPPQPVLAPALADSTVFRIADEGRLPGNYGDIYRLAGIDGASPLELARYRQLLDRLPRARVWWLLSVKYVVTGRTVIDVPAERVAEAPGTDGQPDYLYRLAQPGPRAWLAGDAIAEPDDERLWQRLADPAFDPARQVLLPALPGGYVPRSSCSGEVSLQALEPEHLALSVSAEQPCILVLSELDYPGWRAAIDGRPAGLLRADGAFRGLVVPACQHAVTLDFRPAALAWGALISAATLLAALAWLLWSRRARGA